ncbi:hypothetical protein [Actinoallomurus iriomotensis]|nr:hypothetical protein [Actinoallomurus iriomotensis]
MSSVAAAEAPARIVAADIEVFGRIDVLVNDAAIIRPSPAPRPAA